MKIQFDEETHEYKVDNKKVESVTTILNAMLNKPALINWSANVSCDYIESYIKRNRKEENINTIKLLNAVETARTAWVKKRTQTANSGTRLHKWLEDWGKSLVGKENPLEISEPDKEKLSPIDRTDRQTRDCALGFINALNRFQFVKILNCEKKVLRKSNTVLEAHSTYGQPMPNMYCGTVDMIATIKNNIKSGNTVQKIIEHISPNEEINVVMDWKTSGAVYEENLLQVAAYKQAYEQMEVRPVNAGIVVSCAKEDKKNKVAGNFTIKTISGNSLHQRTSLFNMLVDAYYWKENLHNENTQTVEVFNSASTDV